MNIGGLLALKDFPALSEAYEADEPTFVIAKLLSLVKSKHLSWQEEIDERGGRIILADRCLERP